MCEGSPAGTVSRMGRGLEQRAGGAVWGPTAPLGKDQLPRDRHGVLSRGLQQSFGTTMLSAGFSDFWPSFLTYSQTKFAAQDRSFPFHASYLGEQRGFWSPADTAE